MTTKITWGRNTTNDYQRGKDSYLSSGSPTTNYGNNTVIFARNIGPGVNVIRSIVQVSAASSELLMGDVISAGLYMYVHSAPAGAHIVSGGRLKQDWVEAQVTHNIYSTGNNWNIGGAQSTTDMEIIPGMTRAINSSDIGNYVCFDITNFMNNAVSGAYPDYGFVLGVGGSTVEQGFRSDDNNDTNRPYVQIEFADVAYDDSISDGFEMAETVGVSGGLLPETWGQNTSDTYTVGTDTRISQLLPDTNYSSETHLFARIIGPNVNNIRSFVKLPVTELFANSEIIEATLNLNVQNAHISSQLVSAARVKQDVDLSQTTHNIYSTGNSWNKAGAQSSTDIDLNPIDTIIIDATDEGNYVSFDVTNYIANIVSGGYSDYGFIIGTDSSEEVDFYSAESADGLRPYLEINYIPGGNEFFDSISDGFEIGDTVGLSAFFPFSRLDGMELGDTLFGGVEFGKTASGVGVLLSDVVADTLEASGFSADTFTLADSAAFAYEMNEALSAGTTWSDSASALANVFQPSAADGISLSDSSTFIHDIVVSLSETLNFGDTGTAGFIFVPSAADGLSFSDVATSLVAFAPSASDGITFSDVIFPGFNFSVSGGISLSDSAFGNLIITTTSGSDGLVMVETGTAVVSSVDSVSGGILLSDVSPNTLEASSSAIDGLEFGDTAESAAFVFGESISDGFIIGASGSRVIDYVNIVLDGITMSEIVVSGYIPVLNAIDGITFSEAVSSSQTTSTPIADGFKMGDLSELFFSGAALTISAEKTTLTFVALREE